MDAAAPTRSRALLAAGLLALATVVQWCMRAVTERVDAVAPAVSVLALVGGMVLLLAALAAGVQVLAHVGSRSAFVVACGGLALAWRGLGAVPLLADAGLLVAATALGLVLGRFVDRLSTAILIACVVAVADLVSALAPGGVTRSIVEDGTAARGGSQSLADLLSYSLHAPGNLVDGALTIGLADLVFAATFLAVAEAFVLGRMRNACAIGAAYAAVMCVALTGGRLVVPALPAVAVAFLVANRRSLLASMRFARIARESGGIHDVLR